MNTFSPNMLKTFDTCSIKYYLKYIKNISLPQKSNYFEKGKKIHALANYYLRGDDISKMEKALSCEEQDLWKKLKQNEFFNKTYVNSEYNLSCKAGDFWIGGRLDALVKDDQSSVLIPKSITKNEGEMFYYILDYKTGSTPKKPEFDYQTMVYVLCTEKMFGKNIKFVYIDLKNNKNFVIDNSNTELYEKSIIEICDKITKFKLPEEIEISEKCEFCEFKKLCQSNCFF